MSERKPSLVDVLRTEGLSEEDISFILENKIVAQQAARGLQEICDEIRTRLQTLEGPEAQAYSIRARQLLLNGAFPATNGGIIMLRIAKACLRIAERDPQRKITQKDVAQELGISQQRISQLLAAVEKDKGMNFAQLLTRLEL